MSFAVNHLVGFGAARRASSGTQVVTWNSADKAANITLSNGDMDAEPVGAGWIGVRATLGRASGKYYFELYIVTASSSNIIGGLANASANLQYPGQSANGAGVRRVGKFASGWTHANTTAPGGTDASGDTWMFACDLDANKIWCGVNNVWTSGDPAAGTTEWCNTVTDTVYPMVGFFATSCKARLVVDSASFAYAAPSGFSAWNASP